MKPDKKRSPDKIDDMASLLMAVGLAHAVDFVEPGVDEYLENGFFGTVG